MLAGAALPALPGAAVPAAAIEVAPAAVAGPALGSALLAAAPLVVLVVPAAASGGMLALESLFAQAVPSTSSNQDVVVCRFIMRANTTYASGAVNQVVKCFHNM
jgi:hypothetical protein